jgi:DNA mismatch repair protein MutS
MTTEGKNATLTPMLRQYHEIKKLYPGAILFFRLGDFYELFFEDAILGARELEITLTARHKERGDPIPMCGVPYHAASGYITRLVRKGYRVAICEQTDNPTAAKLLRREVVRIITPGTALESQLLDAGECRYLSALCGAGEGMGVAFLDLSTGEFMATEFRGADAWERLQEQLDLYAPREIIHPRSISALLDHHGVEAGQSTPPPSSDAGHRWPERAILTPLDDWIFGYDHAESLLLSQFSLASLDGVGLGGRTYAAAAAGAAIHYINETQRAPAAHLQGINFYETTDHLVLDATTVSNLELIEATEGTRTLLSVIDETMTGMGARLLRQWLLRPSVRRPQIEARLDAVAALKGRSIPRDEIRRLLDATTDLERVAGRLTLNRATPRDLIALGETAERLPALKQALGALQASLFEVISSELDELQDLRALIKESIADDPPASASEPGVIRDGCHAELDELRQLARSGKSQIAQIEARERGRTGISSLKVKFNQVFGYFIEISHANRDRVPPDYERKQTLVNAERYTTPEIKEYESRVLGAEERSLELESEIFREVRARLAAATRRLQGVARALAQIDAIASLAEVASRRNYTRPALDEGDQIIIRGGRHPVVETSSERFIPNDLRMNNSTDRLLIITGPNMGGKSIFLKQSALIVILAQIGSFVPADSARIALVDRVFTRVGASDNLARGRSTFMVEMTETSNILNTASGRSLILLDEVGRGTATFDGLSLAWAIAEYLHDHPTHSAKTLFATHYHELTELAKLRPGVRNYQVAVTESEGRIVFLRRVVPGAANKSYGIEVARLAGLPPGVVERAQEILANLEQNELDVTGKPKFARHLRKPSAHRDQLSLLSALESDGE